MSIRADLTAPSGRRLAILLSGISVEALLQRRSSSVGCPLRVDLRSEMFLGGISTIVKSVRSSAV